MKCLFQFILNNFVLGVAVAVTDGIIRACQRDSTTNNIRRHSDARVLRTLTMDYIKGYYYSMKSPTADTATESERSCFSDLGADLN